MIDKMAADLRSLKHRAFLKYKPYRFSVAERVEPFLRAYHKVRPQEFDMSIWQGTHVEKSIDIAPDYLAPIPRQIFVFWTGDNPLSETRQQSLNRMREMQAGLDIRLITPKNVDEILAPEAPLHPAYEYLSLMHRADYLRCYVLHFYGGGYADLKAPLRPWLPTFERMDHSEKWMAGYRNPVRLMTPNMPDPVQEKAMRTFSEFRLGQCSYVARPRTPLTAEWWAALNTHLDLRLDDLKNGPGNARGDNNGYALAINEILARLLDPLQVKYRDRLMYQEDLKPDLVHYL